MSTPILAAERHPHARLCTTRNMAERRSSAVLLPLFLLASLTAAGAPPQSGETPPTGTVTFTMDGATLGNASLNPQAPASLATLKITASDYVDNTVTSQSVCLTVDVRCRDRRRGNPGKTIGIH